MPYRSRLGATDWSGSAGFKGKFKAKNGLQGYRAPFLAYKQSKEMLDKAASWVQRGLGANGGVEGITDCEVFCELGYVYGRDP